MLIHGAFKSKAGAVAKEKRVSGGFVVARRIRGHKRYIVLSKKK